MSKNKFSGWHMTILFCAGVIFGVVILALSLAGPKAEQCISLCHKAGAVFLEWDGETCSCTERKTHCESAKAEPAPADGIHFPYLGSLMVCYPAE